MSTGKQNVTDQRRVRPLRAKSCGFPECEGSAVTDAGMCDRHRRVAISSTGSWLESGRRAG